MKIFSLPKVGNARQGGITRTPQYLRQFSRWQLVDTSLLSICLLLFPIFLQAQVFPCNTFSPSTQTNNWVPQATTITAQVPGPSGAFNDFYMRTLDLSGQSRIYNDIDFGGNWINDFLGAELCWDFNYIFDGGSGNSIIPSISIYSGNPLAPSLRATFNANFSVDQNTGWIQICAPISTCTNGLLPYNAEGSWVMNNGSGCGDWTSLLANVSGIRIETEAIVNNTSELLGFDNICIQEIPPFAECRGSNNPNFLQNWETANAITYTNEPGADGPGDTYLETNDLSGNSLLYNEVNFDDNWTQLYNGFNLCWDYNLVEDGTQGNNNTVTPALTVYRGNVNSPSLSATFTANFTVSEGDGWVQICAPILSCSGALPSNSQGAWTIDGGGDCTDWNSLLNNVDGISFDIELIVNNLNDRSGFDNICFEPLGPFGDCAANGNPNFIQNWQAAGAAIYMDVPGPAGNTDEYLETDDETGDSWLYNSTDFGGNWNQLHLGQSICWDYKLVSDGSSGSNLAVAPTLSLYRGNPTNPTLSATFTANFTVTESDGWVRVCAPILSCSGSNPPVGADGAWTIDGGGTCNTWNNLLTNVTGVRFNIELVTNNTSEQNGFDNICFEDIGPFADCSIPDNPNQIQNWGTLAANAFLSEPGADGPGDTYLETQDLSGNSAIFNSTDFAGNWAQTYNSYNICWDYRLVEDGTQNNTNDVTPSITLYQGNPSNPTLSATFTANFTVSESDGWVRICAPIFTCGGATLPAGSQGTWAMDNGGTCSSWNSLLNSVSGVLFDIELIVNNLNDRSGFDNICLEPVGPFGDCAENGNPNFLQNWQAAGALHYLDTPGPAGNNDTYLETDDEAGDSWLYNSADFGGNWTQLHVGQSICWDYKLVSDGSSGGNVNVAPSISLYQGNPTNPALSATFTANFTVSEADGWVRVCAPIFDCSVSLPANAEGAWTIDGGGDCTDWTSLLNNVTGVRFNIELVTNNTSEQNGFDNICFEDFGPFADCGGAKLDDWGTSFADAYLNTPGPGGTNDLYLETNDASGPSRLFNVNSYGGDWTVDYLGQSICWDYRIVDAAVGTTTAPAITVFRGNPNNPTTSATFTANFTVSENTGWVQICAPILLCNGNTLPTGNQGSWSMDGGGDCNDWEDLLENVTGIRFPIEISSNNVSERNGFDNICFSCNDDQEISIDASVLGDRLYEFTVQGFQSSATPVTYTWDFGDGGTGTGTIPYYGYQYLNEGDYEVCVQVEDNAGCRAETCLDISVICCDSLDASFEYSLIEGCFVFIQDFDPNDTWTLDGSPVTASPINLSNSGTNVFELCRTVFRETLTTKCVDTYCTYVPVFGCGEPVVDCSGDLEIAIDGPGDSENACQFTFTNTTINSPGWSSVEFFWEMSDGTTYGNLTTVNHTFASTGSTASGEVCLYAVINGNCILEECFPISAKCFSGVDLPACDDEPDCLANFSYRFGNGCLVNFTDLSLPANEIVSYQWDFDDGTTSNAQNPSHAFPGNGTYTVCLTITTVKGCQSTYCEDVVVENCKPSTLFVDYTTVPCRFARSAAKDNARICLFCFQEITISLGDPVVSWVWTLPGGTTQFGPNLNFAPPNGSDVFTVCLTATTLSGQSATVCKEWTCSGGFQVAASRSGQIATEKATSFEVFPNPVLNAQVTLQIEGITSDAAELQIINSLGQLSRVIEGVEEGTQTVNIADLNPGVYFFVLKQPGQALQTRRIIVGKGTLNR